MRTETALALGTSSSQPQSDRFLYQRGPKRKFDALLLHTRQGDASYPSPPMSSPPSPPGPPLEPSLPTASEPPTTTLAPPVTLPPLGAGRPPTLPGVQFTAPPPPPPIQAPYISPFQAQGPAYAPTTASVFQTPTTSAAPSTAGEASNVDSPPIRSGRKSRGHVASACINCKKAHLSCDVQRPCARCVASGKQDTCIDVQHKKRGRPRLHEERDFKVEQIMPDQSPRQPASLTSSPGASRPLARSRHSRTESLRSLRSHISDSSGAASALPTPTFPSPGSSQTRFSFQPGSFPPPGLPSADVPTAYLDIDFVFIRANTAFRQAMYNGGDVRGRRLNEVAAPADNESFQSIRNRLRDEREAREPSYMPPILSMNQDPLEGVSDANIDQFSQGFTDRTFIWTQSGSMRDRFTVRVRLAKANAYFVVVTLPPVRPATAPHPATISSPFAVPSATAMEGYQPYVLHPPPPRYYQAAPQQHQSPYGQPPPPSAYQGYQQPGQPAQSYQQPPAPVTPRPPMQGTPFTPPSAQRGPEPPQGVIQLPPILGQSAAPAAPSTSATAETQQPRTSSDEGDDERSPKKRRRMGIGDVLQ